MASIKSTFSKGLTAVESVLSVVDIVDDSVSIATGYLKEFRTKQELEAAVRMDKFHKDLLIQQASNTVEYEADMYKLGSKAKQLRELPNFQENVQAFNDLLKVTSTVTE